MIMSLIVGFFTALFPPLIPPALRFLPGRPRPGAIAAAGTAHQLATGSEDWVDPQHEPIMVS